MYSNPAAIAGSGVVAGSGLAMTGLNVMWLLLAAFALVAAGGALLRILPRRRA